MHLPRDLRLAAAGAVSGAVLLGTAVAGVAAADRDLIAAAASAPAAQETVLVRDGARDCPERPPTGTEL